MTKGIRVTYRGLRRAAFSYLLVPLLLFLIFYLKPVFAVPAAGITLAAWALACFGKADSRREKPLYCAWYELLLVLALAVAWVYFAGFGNFFYQVKDWNERNAVFRDLIRYDWPVYYTRTETVLTYYVGHWLPSALIGKIVYKSTLSLDTAWQVGNWALTVWSALGIVLTVLLLFKAVQADTFGKRCASVLLMVAFSGLDVIGALLKGWDWNGFMARLHLEWWDVVSGYQFSSNTTCLFWSFNQTIPLWLATLCFVNENKGGIRAGNYGFIAICALICGPLPDVGLVLMMAYAIVYAAVKQLRKRQFKAWLRDVFSFGNLAMALCVFPFVGLYLMANMAYDSTPGTAGGPAFSPLVGVCLALALAALALALGSREASRRKTGAFLTVNFAILAAALFLRAGYSSEYPLFLLLEVGVYFLLLFLYGKTNYLYYAAGLVLALSPLFRVGLGGDFCRRASIPGLLVLLVLCLRFLFTGTMQKRHALPLFICKMVLITALIIGACTPAMEFYRGFAEYENRGTADTIYTLNKRHTSGGLYGNFVSADWENSFFFTHLSSLKH